MIVPINGKFPRAVQDLSDWLISRYGIQPGFGLAQYLGISRRYDNHAAVLVWVYNQYISWAGDQRTTGHLRQEFVRRLPLDGF